MAQVWHMSFDVAAEAYDGFMGRYSRLLSGQLADLASVRAGQRVLDVDLTGAAFVVAIWRALIEGWIQADDGPAPATHATVPILREFERRLGNLVEGFFATTFRSGLQPVELAKRVMREMDAGKTVGVRDIWAPNHFTFTLSGQDGGRFEQAEQAIVGELQRVVRETALERGRVRVAQRRNLAPVETEQLLDVRQAARANADAADKGKMTKS